MERCIDDELPFEIPENWCWCKIGTIFTLQAGKNIQAAEIHENPFADSYPCYGGNGIRGYVASSNRTGDYPIIGRQGALCGNINRATGEFYACYTVRDCYACQAGATFKRFNIYACYTIANCYAC